MLFGNKSGHGTLPSSAGMPSVTDPAHRMAVEHQFLKHNLGGEQG